MITPQNILQHEIIGLRTGVVHCSEKGLIGVTGEIVDETRQTVILLSEGKRRIVPKNVATFRISLPSGDLVEVQGQVLIGRPEDRIKARMARHR